MRIDELRLMAFGPFTDAVLDLSAGKEGFHLIYGANEAGKSSALRALRYMLYGIPERSTDNFIHSYSKMRLGATIRSENGRVLKCVRRKGRMNTLRDFGDTAVLDEIELQQCLGGVNAELFATMFGIGHEDLVRGGQDIISGGGDVGRLVFSAGSGIVNLREIQNELQMNADQLFKPSGQKPKINAALGQLKRHRKSLRDAQLPGREWAEHDAALGLALKQKDAVETRLNACQKKLNRFQRIQEALPFIAKRRQLMDEWMDYASTVILPRDFPKKRQKLLTTLGIAEREKSQAGQNIESTKQAISELEVFPGLLENAGLIEEIHRELGSQHKASRDRVDLETRRNTLRGEAKEILHDLQDDLKLEEAEKLRIKKAETVRIQELSVQYERFLTRIEDTREQLPDLILELDRIQKDLETLPWPKPVDVLKLTVSSAVEYASLERQNRSDISELQSALKSLSKEKQRLGLGGVPMDELEHMPVPSTEKIHMVEDRFATADRQKAEIRQEIKKLRSSLLEVQHKIETLRLEQEVPTEIDLQNARNLRDRGWQLIVSKLKNEKVSQEELQTYVNRAPDSETIIEAFEKNLQQADIISDRLRREADRVAAKARLLSDQISFKRQLQELEKDLKDLDLGIQSISDEWKHLWRPLGITPGLPKEMGRWIHDYQTLMEKLKDNGRRREKADALRRDVTTHREKMIQCLNELEQPVDRKADSLRLLIQRAETVIEDETLLLHRREQLMRDKGLKEKELAAAQSRLESNEKDLKHWQRQWEDAVTPIGLDSEALPAQANAVMDLLKSLFNMLKEAKILQKRMDGIDRDAEIFEQKVGGLVEVIAKDLVHRPGDEAALELHRRLKQSRDARSKKEALVKQLEFEQKRFRQATHDIVEVDTRLKGMCRDASCHNIEELSDAEGRSHRKRQIEADLKTVDESLQRLSGGCTVDEFVSEAIAEDPDTIDAEIEHLQEVILDLNQQKSELDQTIGSERTELSKMDGSAHAAERAEEIQILLGSLATDVEHYSRLKIAIRLLGQAIERFRDKSQGPILKRASALFHQITDGSFEGLRAEFDSKGQPVIVGIRRKNKEIVSVEGMSDGTRDQLYLALRLAGLEVYLETNEAIPFIVDDILIKFDNWRAVAALKALAKLSEKTQLIFFTHHRHLVRLAEENISPSVLIKHILPVTEITKL